MIGPKKYPTPPMKAMISTAPEAATPTFSAVTIS